MNDLRVMPDFKSLLDQLAFRATMEGISITWDEGYRDVVFQQGLLDCWNDPTDDYACRKRRGIIYQPAIPGTSYHNWGRAIDFDSDNIARVGQIAEELGLRYGGSFGDIKHIDDGHRYTIEQAKAAFDAGALIAA